MPDDATTAGAAQTAATTDTSTGAQNPPPDTATSQTTQTTDANPTDASGDKPRTFTQTEVSALIARETKKALEAHQAQTERAQQEAAAKDKTEFDAIVTRYKGELATASEELASLRTVIHAAVEEEMKGLPAALQAFDPGADASAAARLDWMVKAKAAAAQLVEELGAKANGQGNGQANGQRAGVPLIGQRGGGAVATGSQDYVGKFLQAKADAKAATPNPLQAPVAARSVVDPNARTLPANALAGARK